MPKKTVQQTGADITVSLLFEQKETELKGQTIPEKLANLPEKIVTAKGVIIARKGKQEFSVILNPMLFRRLRNNALARELMEKRIKLAFG